MRKGDIVLIPFPFTDLTGSKDRPALILAVFEKIIIVSFITSQVRYQQEYDILLEPDEYNRLQKLSILRLNKLVSLDKELVIGKLGNISATDFQKIYRSLMLMFQPDRS